MAIQISTKRVLIDKTNSTIVAVTAVAAFVVIFSLVATKTLISQATYQNRIIADKKVAVTQLKSNIQATSSLATAYETFVTTPQNVLGGSLKGTGALDGDNAKIVLDALPSKYDFPALVTSLEVLLSTKGVQIQSITGTDEEKTQSSTAASPQPAPVPMPFQVAANGNYKAIQNLVGAFGASIRPFQIQALQISGDQKNMTLTINAQTYYQPEKILGITKKVVK